MAEPARRWGVAWLALLVPSLAQAATIALPGGPLTITQRGARTVLAAKTGRVVLPAESGIYPHSLDGADLLGIMPGGLLVLSTHYASRPGAPMAMCGAGTETVLRVVALRPSPHQTFSDRIESCWTSIEADAVRWDAARRSVTIRRLAADGITDRTYAVQRDGSVRLNTVPVGATEP